MYATALIVAATCIPAAYANSVTDVIGLPHIGSTTQFPRAKWGNVRHSFQIQIPQNCSALSQLDIDVPVGLSVKNNIEVFDKSGRKIQANTSVNGNKIAIIFSMAISQGNTISIDLNKVNIRGASNAWLYRVSAKMAGVDAEIPIGIAQFSLSF